VLDNNTKHITLIGKTSDRSIALFVTTLKRNAPNLINWTFSTATAKIDLFSAASNISTFPNEDHGIWLITCIYFLVQECFLIPFNASDLEKLKLHFSYWLAVGNLPI